MKLFEQNVKNPRLAGTLACLAIMMAVFCLSAVARADEPTVETDQTSYEPGSWVFIAGAGFAADENVTLLVSHLDNSALEPGIGNLPWTVAADADGNFTTIWYVDPGDTAYETLLLTAIGAGVARDNGNAQTTFHTGGFSGALWTTNDDCTVQDANQYAAKGDVYLHGDGYEPGSSLYVQVIGHDDQGQHLLGTSVGSGDPTPILVGANGEFVTCYKLWDLVSQGGDPGFADTPNPDGVYTVEVSDGPDFAQRKSDNFKVGGTVDPCANDTTPPVLTLGAAPVSPIECPNSPVFNAATATDNCDGAPAVTFTDETVPGNCAGSYVVTRTWKATDASLNESATQSQSVTVQDTTPPVLGAPGLNATIECPASPVFTAPTANDSCDGNPSVIIVTSDAIGGDCVNGFTHTRTWKARDCSGNESGTKSQTITVKDTIKPVFPAACPIPSTYLLHQPVAPVSITATDACSGDITVSATPDTSTVGPHTVTFTATDCAGNTATKVCCYTVKFASCGDPNGLQVLQPVNYTQSYSDPGMSTFKKGSTVPVKFRACDALGVSQGPPPYIVKKFELTGIFSPAGSVIVNEEITSTTPDTQFRWTGDQWIFNLGTSTLVSGKGYEYKITLIDDSVINFRFKVK